ncbi:MAG: TetR family transcriptional regulator [Gammaproteobacteria bacterium]|nr:MAG: TetR family transcriptional regulator [Gammaproteobacteria bacterium]
MNDDIALNYRGRKASRARSEQRRKAILEAALRLVVSDGVRGVRHRAVAKEAEVPLSATTYYFKDIGDLIVDTFTLFAEKAMSDVVVPVHQDVAAFIAANDVQTLTDPATSRQLVDAMATLIAAHIHHELCEKRDHLIAEQAFMHESIRDPKLKDMARHYYEHLVLGMKKLCEQLAIQEPEIAADMLMATIFRIEYEGLLLENPAAFDVNRAKKILKRQFLSLIQPVND